MEQFVDDIDELGTRIAPAVFANPLRHLDEKARKEKLNPSDRHLLRLEKAKPLLEQIKTAIHAARGDALPKSALAKACNYTLTLWQRLIRFWTIPLWS